jgi:hypothetical protein
MSTKTALISVKASEKWFLIVITRLTGWCPLLILKHTFQLILLVPVFTTLSKVIRWHVLVIITQALSLFTGWNPEPSPNRNRSFSCRFLIKAPDNQDETMEEKQQRISRYENMQVRLALSLLDREIGNISFCSTHHFVTHAQGLAYSLLH